MFIYKLASLLFITTFITVLVFTILSLKTVLKKKMKGHLKKIILLLFICNISLYIMWNYLFFGVNFFATAAVGLSLIILLLLILFYYVWPVSKKACFLLLPYMAWSFFSSILNISIF